MSVVQRLMKPGGFSFEISPNAPAGLFQAVQEFDHIVITGVRLDPIEAFSDANILSSAIYTGVVTNKPSHREFVGFDLSYWLGTPQGLGDILDTAVERAAGTLTQWVGDLCPSSLTVGTVVNTSAVTARFQYVTRREALDSICKWSQAEWRVNPDGTLDAGGFGDLFVVTPTTMITRYVDGPEQGFQGLDGSLITVGIDVEQYTTKAFIMGKIGNTGIAAAIGTATGTTPYYDFNNNAVVMERLADQPDNNPINMTFAAQAVVDQYNDVRRQITLRSRTYIVPRFVQPGDNVYVYDPLSQMTDDANQVTWRGELVFPVSLRVQSLTWPIERGVGVYARRRNGGGGGAIYTDLTDHVLYESGDTELEVGAAASPLIQAGI